MVRAMEWKPAIRAGSLAARAEMLCHAVAPELAGQPVYIALRSDLPRDWAGGEDYAGCTIAHLDLILRPTLEWKRRWRGRGPAILIDAAAIATAARYRPRAARKRVFLPAFFSIVLHELAHVLDMDFVPKLEPEDWWVRAGRRLFSEPAAPNSQPTNGPGAPVPWRMHEWPFIRIAMHLAERASAAGADVSPRDVIDLGEYGLSSTFQYARALGDEPARMAGCDFEEIRRATPPTAFTDLWWADVERWVSQTEMTNEIPMTLAACCVKFLHHLRERDVMLTELLTELESRRTNREAEFWTIAQKLAAGEKVAAAAVERLLAESGKPPAELKKAVEIIQQRRHWHAIISAEPALEKERAAIKDRIAAEDRKLAAAEQVHADATGPMYARLDFIKAHVSDASDARRRLMETCPYTELKAELAATQERLNEQRNRVAALKRQAGRADDAEDDRAEARRHAEGVTPGSHPRHIAEWRERAERNQRAADAAKAELPQAEKEVARLEKEEAAIYERMTTP